MRRAGASGRARTGIRARRTGAGRGAWVVASLAAVASSVLAQNAGRAPPRDPDEEETVVVSAQRERGAVIGDIKPELQLGPAEIRSLGVTSVSELLSELGPELRSLRGGPPIVLLEGRRISSFAEIRDIPAEAIVRVDILPEEVALAYGYSADQKVMNIVLRQRFRAWTGEARLGRTTEGGAADAQANATYLAIRRDARLNASVQASHRDRLLESQRDIVAVTPARPFDSLGNLGSLAYGQPIDARLSALAGTPVIVAAVPGAARSRPLTLADLVPTANRAAVTDLAPLRTLLPATDGASANLVWKTTAESGTAVTLNGRLQHDEQLALNGLPGVVIALPVGSPYSPFAAPVGVYRYDVETGALRQTTNGTQYHAGLTLDSAPAPWHWNVIANLDRSENLVTTQAGVEPAAFQALVDAGGNPFAPFGTTVVARAPSTARTLTQSASAEALLNGSPFHAPAGDARLAVKLLASANELESNSVRFGLAQRANLSRDAWLGHVNLDLPLASRDVDRPSALGGLGLNANAQVQHLSDFGTLSTVGYGLSWQPLERVSILVSHTAEETAPTMPQLQGPLTVTPNVAILDPLTGAAAVVTRISGGSSALLASHSQVLKASVNWTPLLTPRLQFSASYLRTRTDDPTATLPTSSAAIAQAFSERFLRDTSGVLTQVDVRPVNFAHAASDSFRWGANFSMPIASPRAAAAAEAMRQAFAARRAAGAQPPATGQSGGQPSTGSGDEGRRPRGEGGPRGGGQGGGPGAAAFGGRLQLALYHTIVLRDELVVRQGVPLVDLLHGGSSGSAGGTARQQLELQAGLTRDGLGAWITGSWQSATTVLPGPLNPGGDLHFAAFGTANARFFANLGGMPDIAMRHPWLRGVRVSLAIENVFDTRQRVTDSRGATPLPYQPALLAPAGRTVTLGFRKFFFTGLAPGRGAGEPRRP